METLATVCTSGVYDTAYNHKNGMKSILYETRHLDLSNHINYKVIELVLREIWFFEVYLEILCFVPGSMDCEGYNSTDTTQKWV